MIRLFIILTLASPMGEWVDGTQRACPSPRDYGSAGRGGLKLAAGCVALAPGVWVGVEAHREVFVAVAELRAERDEIKRELAEARAELAGVRIDTATQLAACASSLKLAAGAVAEPCECPGPWRPLAVGIIGGALGGAGLVFGVTRYDQR